MKRYLSAPAACFVLALALGLGWGFSPWRERAEQLNIDAQFRLLRALTAVPIDGDPVLVGIDDATYAGYPEPFALWHAHLGALFNALSLGKPSVVGLDVVLPTRSYSFLGENYDRALLRGLYDLKQVAPVAVAKTIVASGELRPLFAPIVSIAGPDSLGLVVVPVDSDRVLRRYRAQVESEAGPIATLAAVMAKSLGHDVGDGSVNFGVGAPVPYVPMQDVIAWRDGGETQKLEATFRGRPVLIGAVLPFEDVFPYPVALSAWKPDNLAQQPGVLVHLQALRSYMTGGLLTASPRWSSVALLVAMAGLAWLGSVRVGTVMTLTGVNAVWAGSTFALTQGSVLPVTGAIGAGLLSVAIRSLLDTTLAVRERRRLRQSFGSYVSPTVLEGIMHGTISTSGQGERREVCVLFSDVRDFTTLSETRTPEAIISLLNDYFTEMTAAVHAHGGTVDKFIGDGLMCFFGAPARLENPSLNAFEAAREMTERLVALNRRFEAESRTPLRIGIGLHYGEALIGHVGSETRNEYTAIGDTVNVASRIEGLTKGLGRAIIASETVVAAVGPHAAFECLGPQALKGHAAMTVYGWPASQPRNNERRSSS